MKRNAALVQARMLPQEVQQLDADVVALGLHSRSEAIRTALRLLHQRARDEALGQSYDDYYGKKEAPLSELASIGHLIAAQTLAERG